MTAFFRLSECDESAPVLVTAPMPDIKAGARVSNWTPPTCVLEGPGLDLHRSDEGVLVVSERFRQVVAEVDPEKHARRVQFLPLALEENGSRQAYYFLHVPVWSDVLNQEHTVFLEPAGRWLRPCIDPDKASDLHLFQISPNEIAVFVSKRFKDAAVQANLEGVEFLLALSHHVS